MDLRDFGIAPEEIIARIFPKALEPEPRMFEIGDGGNRSGGAHGLLGIGRKRQPLGGAVFALLFAKISDEIRVEMAADLPTSLDRFRTERFVRRDERLAVIDPQGEIEDRVLRE